MRLWPCYGQPLQVCLHNMKAKIVHKLPGESIETEPLFTSFFSTKKAKWLILMTFGDMRMSYALINRYAFIYVSKSLLWSGGLFKRKTKGKKHINPCQHYSFLYSIFLVDEVGPFWIYVQFIKYTYLLNGVIKCHHFFTILKLTSSCLHTMVIFCPFCFLLQRKSSKEGFCFVYLFVCLFVFWLTWCLEFNACK